MLAYLFWHVPLPGVDTRDYEAALLDFQAELARAPPAGLESCMTYQISETPWLSGRKGYEDWYFMKSGAALELLNPSGRK